MAAREGLNRRREDFFHESASVGHLAFVGGLEPRQVAGAVTPDSERALAMSCQWSRLHKPIGLICMFLVLAAVACSSTPPAPPPEVDPLAGVRTLVQQQQWVMALNRLEAHRERGSADWHQLMAYCLLQRQLQAGLAGRVHMERLVRPHLDAALAANPGHRASLQTAGLLALELGDIAGARRFWVALDESCFLPCRPSLALQAAIEESVDPQAGWE